MSGNMALCKIKLLLSRSYCKQQLSARRFQPHLHYIAYKLYLDNVCLIIVLEMLLYILYEFYPEMGIMFIIFDNESCN